MAKILLIDDEPVLRLTFRHFLEDAGYEVSEAEDGRKGLQSCVATPPDLVITDVFMPEMGGRETVEAIREQFHDMPVLVISGQCQRLRDTEVPCDDGVCFLPKPVEKPELLSIVTLLLETKGECPPNWEPSAT